MIPMHSSRHVIKPYNRSWRKIAEHEPVDRRLQFKTTEDPDPHLVTDSVSARCPIYMDDCITVHPEHSGCTGIACIAPDISEIHRKIGSTALADVLRLLYLVGVDAKQNTNVVRDNINDGKTIHSDFELPPEGDVDNDSDALTSSEIMNESTAGEEGEVRMNEVNLIYVQDGKLVHDVKVGSTLDDVGRKRPRLSLFNRD
jgi:hypothetical protein